VEGLLTKDERLVITFLVVATAVGAIVLGLRKIDPALVPDLAPSAEVGAAPVADAPTGPVAVNEASAEELTRLPGIGPAKARAIVSYRERHGPFATLDGLLDVNGIGPLTLERLRPLATVNTPLEG